MQDERRVALDFHELREVLLLLAHVDERVPIVVENPEVSVHTHVDAGGLQELVVVGLDLDPAFRQEAGDRTVCKHHPSDSRGAGQLSPGLLGFRTLPSILQPVDPNERFKMRRRQRQQEIRRRRLVAAGCMLALIGAGVVGGVLATHIHSGHTTGAPVRAKAPTPTARTLAPRPYPTEVRGVHVTMALASIPGKIEQYIALKAQGLNTIELDVKDENGEIAFPTGVRLADKLGAAKRYYDPRVVARKIHAAGIYLIGRVVTFEDSILSAGWPAVAVRRPDGSRWLTNGGLGWTNPYDKRVW